MLKIYTVIFLVFISFSSFAQANFDNPYHKRPNAKFLNEGNSSSENFTGFSGTGANIDVIFHRIFWRINPDSSAGTLKYIRGNVVFGFKTITTNVSAITFDLRSVLTVDSIIFRGTRYTTTPAITRSGDIVTFNLGTTIASIGSIDSFRVYYQGTPPAVSGFAQGYQIGSYTATNPTTVTHRYVNTLSESYEDRDWWPCKADMQDKIDSMDITVSVPWTGPDTFWVATNGVLVDSTINGSNRTFTFKTRYPIPSYLVSVCVARYNRFYRNITLTSGSKVPVTYNILRGKTAAAQNTIVANWDIHNQTLIKFSEKLGDYPFKREKHGFYEGLQGASGMEHQTFSAIATGSVNSHTTLAHELMHQWFGDKATFATWADLWLAEGMGSYSQVLAGELVPATGINPTTALAGIRTTAKALLTTPVRLTSFNNSNIIWTNSNDSAVYPKGAMVHSMLRLLSGDNLYFQALRNYLDSANGSGYKSATTDSLRVNFERVLNRSLVDFFDDWVVKTGSSSTVVNWNTPSTNVLALQIASQTKYPLSSPVSRYSNVFGLRLQAAPSFDTTIAIFNPALDSLALVGNGIGPMAFNTLYVTLNFTPTSVTFDSTKTLTGGSTFKLNTLDLKILDFNVKKNGVVNDAVFVLDNNSINSVIVLERSANGVNFTELAPMQLNTNNSQNNKEYYYRDLAPLSGDNYYRVKYKYVDGNYRYSKIIKINSPVSTTSDYFSVINNPVKEVLQLKVLQTGLQNQKVSLSILDATGKLITKLNTVINNQLLQVDVKKLSKGSYIIKIENENQVLQSLKFVVL